MRDETYGGALYPPNKEPLIIRCNCITKTDELDALQKTLQKQAGDKPVVLLPWYCEVIQSESRWILCKEKLPKTDGHYLVSNSRNVFEAVFMEGEWYSMSLNLLLDGVLAWMFLPEPYKGEQDG